MRQRRAWADVRTGAVVVSVAAVMGGEATAEGEMTWEPIREESGVQVWKRPAASGSIVEFKSEAVIEAPAVRVAAAIREFDRHSEWMEGCTASHVLRYPATFSAVGYHRFASRVFFIRDRDVVIAGSGEFDPDGKRIRIRFESIDDKKAPPLKGVVRMPRLTGHFELTALDDQRTRVQYEVYADPGGSLPDWVVNFIFAEVPYKTITRLREQVAKPGYEAVVEVLEASQAIAGKSPTTYPERVSASP